MPRFKFKTVQKIITSDGAAFDNKADAIRHETKLALRGIIQEGETRETTYTATQIANLILTRETRIKLALLSCSRAINGSKRKKAVDNVPAIV